MAILAWKWKFWNFSEFALNTCYMIHCIAFLLTVHFLGWIMKVKLSDESELSGLMDEESYTTFCDEQES